MKLIVATVTPHREGGVDLSRLAEHIRWLASRGVDGIAPTGTTGELLFLSHEERRQIHAICLEAAGSIEVIPCVWDPLITRAAALARHAEQRGATAVFLPPPLYQPVPADNVVAWYRAVCEAVDIPVLAYHHPRTHNPLGVALVQRLLEAGVAGLKDSSGDPARLQRLCALGGVLYAGGDSLLGPDLPADGHISRYANVYPEDARALLDGGPRQWLEDRLGRIDRAGGIAATKALLGMGGRLPVGVAADDALAGLHRPSFGGPDVVLIGAMTEDRIIGAGAGMPWDVPEEYRQYLGFVRGNTVVMGRKSWEIFGPDLRGEAHCVVVTRSGQLFEDAETAASLEEALDIGRRRNSTVFVAGGGRIYAQAMPHADAMFLSTIHGHFTGDVQFPVWQEDDWRVVRTEEHPAFTFREYRRGAMA